MKFKHTACLAALLMACPVTCQTALGGTVWDENKVSIEQVTMLESSGHMEIFPQASGSQTEYDSVYIGHAEVLVASVGYSNGNTGIIGSGMTVTNQVIGGYVSQGIRVLMLGYKNNPHSFV